MCKFYYLYKHNAQSCTCNSEKISIPIIHIAEATADALKETGIEKVGLLGTKYTMTQEFYKSKLIEAGIEVVIPDEVGVTVVNNIIYNELCLGIISEESRKKFVNIIKQLEKAGAQGVILGCTEIGLLIQQAVPDNLHRKRRHPGGDCIGPILWRLWMMFVQALLLPSISFLHSVRSATISDVTNAK